MKRILTLTLALILCLSAVAVLASCDHEHTASADWAKDDTNHWHTCADCEEQLDKAEHTFGEATKVKNGVYSYTCTVCGQVKTETMETKITAEQFTNMTLGENYIVSVYAVHETQGTYSFVAMRDGNKWSNDEKMEVTGYSGRDYYFIEIDGEDVYVYETELDDDGNIVTCIKEKRDEMTPAQVIESNEQECLPNSFRDLSLFTYDEQTNTYVAASIVKDSYSLTNVKVAFENGKIVAMSYTENYEGNGSATYEFTFVYGTASVTLPEVTTPAT